MREKTAISSKKKTIDTTDKSLTERGTYIRKVILENFLSFQRDEVDFSTKKNKEIPRFVLIIGPNWSGKTSIFQAIKFALGSNERDERYKKWSDFIRNSQAHAMVELHIQYHTEIIKIRRTVIKGKSPFFEIQFDKDKEFKKAHVTEVQKLVSKLDINPDNQFAFVSQGKIDAIKNLKPIELCSFLEEGIGLKGLRDEILQQKKGVLTLNTEFQSLISRKNALNINLDLLTPKLKRLREKNKLLDIKKKYTDELLWANKGELQKEIEELEVNLSETENQIDITRKEIDKYQNLINEKDKTILDVDTKISNFSEKLGVLGYKKQEFINEISKWQKEKISAKSELDKLAEKLAEKKRILKNIENQKKNVDEKTDVIKTKTGFIKTKINGIIKEQSDLTRKIKENDLFLEKYNKLSQQRETILRTIQENENNIEDVKKDINDIFQSLKDIDHKLSNNKWFLENPTEDLLKQLDINLKRVTVELLNFGAEIEKIEYNKSKKISEFKRIQTALRERKIVLSPNINILKEEIKKRDLSDRVKGPIIEYLKYDDKLSYAIESVLGERLLNSFIASDWDTLNLMERLKKKYNAYCNIYIPKKGNITAYPKIAANGLIGYLVELIEIINGDSDIQKVIYSIIKNCIVVDDYQSAKEIYRTSGFKGKCVTLQGKQIISYRYAYESPHVKRLKGLLSTGTQKEQSNFLEKEIKSLNNKVLELKVELTKLDKHQSDILRKKESFTDLLFNFKQKERLTTKKNHQYNLIYSLEQRNKEINNNLNEVSRKLNDLESQKDPEFFDWNKRIKEIPSELNNYNDELKKWEEKLSENLESLKEISEKLNYYTNDLKSSEDNYNSKKDAFEKSDKKAFRIYIELENLEEELLNVNNVISELKGKKKITLIEKKEIDKSYIQQNLRLEQEIFKQASISRELGIKEDDLKRVISEIGPLIEEEVITLRPIQDINQDILNIDKNLLKYFDIDDSILVEKEQVLKGLKEITKNQREIEIDIKAALKTENKMEDTYFDKFHLVLKKLNSRINDKFKSTDIKAYCTLELIGTFEDLGIDIKAAISKDQLKSCKALSGGQISMISIGLILSLLEIKSSPIVMLDEAGMFLDDRNSEASYKMIKSTLENNSIQMLLFLPKSSNALYLLADKLIGVARVGKKDVSTIFNPKIVKEG
ncbi:MAG TPA: AAA family ATPase [Candidatus Nanopelagicaceae bacterium]|nr:AAA family ATPase [Candidatus Nanopelagicaceae bacterium]